MQRDSFTMRLRIWHPTVAVLGCCNDYLGYLPPTSDVDRIADVPLEAALCQTPYRSASALSKKGARPAAPR